MYADIEVAQLVIIDEAQPEHRGSLHSSQLKIAVEVLYRLTMNLM